MTEPTTDYLLSDTEVELFEAWLEDNDGAPPCVISRIGECDEPAAHKWTMRPCGCVYLVCETHHPHFEAIKANGMRAVSSVSNGARVRCDLGCGALIDNANHHPI
jgi:hypothetical protein